MNNSQKAAYILRSLDQYLLQAGREAYYHEVLRLAISVALEQTPDERHIEDAQLRCCPFGGPPSPVDAAATQHLAAMIAASSTWPEQLFYNLDMGRLLGY
ncbi:hypothetical protein [Pseudomonas syringae]|uniref:hypothetical protein n=1 Tax=Pseudomonas syringae TaxID=317 RepID=UPI000D9AB2A1|nr:hypothetical protein [Pseudomonas syringae]PYD18374.1 hypothetical protein DND47_04340 [Pseudomonas syringae pv. syringae]